MTRKKLIKSEVVKMFNTTKETLRHYENLNILKPEVSENNYKHYGNEDLIILQKILFLRELGIQLNDIEKILSDTTKTQDNIDILKVHYKKIHEKLQRLTSTYDKVGQLLKLIENRENVFETFNKKSFNKRFFYHFAYNQIEITKFPKLFYERFKPILEKGIYSKSPFSIIYPYEKMDNYKNFVSKHCIQIDKIDSLDKKNIITLPQGEYLCIYYIIDENDWSKVTELKNNIDMYLANNNLTIKNCEILEIEHQEFSLVCEQGQNVYEIQIPIENTKIN